MVDEVHFYLFQPVGHFLLHLLQGCLSCLVLMNDFIPWLLQFFQELLHPALQLQKQKSPLVKNLAGLPSQQGDTLKNVLNWLRARHNSWKQYNPGRMGREENMFFWQSQILGSFCLKMRAEYHWLNLKIRVNHVFFLSNWKLNKIKKN